MHAHTVHPRIRPGLAAVGAVVLLVHGVLLGGWAPGPGREPRGDGDRPQAVQRVAQAVSTVRLPAAAPVPSSTAQPPRALPVASPGARGHARPQAAAAPMSMSAPTATSRADVDVDVDVDAVAGASASTAAMDAPTPGGVPVPTYATQLPPSTTLQFTLRRGTATGRAELAWQAEAGRYQLQMRGQVLAAPQLVWRSEGTLDAHGIAPTRYAEWRRGRELRAANFQRGGDDGRRDGGRDGGDSDAGRITFSGPQVQYPLLAGAQDRISWMLQLPAVLAANPGLQAPGSTVQLFVAGARGDAEVWTFTVQGTGAVTLADGSSIAAALHLQREPSRPYDTRADIWLDPAHGHLPVRALLTVRPGGDATEFVLERPLSP